MSYTKSNRNGNWSMDDLKSPRALAMTKMPNMSPYVIGDEGNRTGAYFTPLFKFQGGFTGSAKSMVYNPVAMVNESKIIPWRKMPVQYFEREYDNATEILQYLEP